ncbi:MAG: phosphonate C-P lyase system protein PhnH, partial [Phreatobacter sp.]|nr:phosphonate C-P lyase system protein PhnH [Phreatobacter sp.]
MAIALAFADPVHDAQQTFRAVMNAMARPGTIHAVPGLAAAPAPLLPVAAAVAVALADYETPLWLDASLAAAPDVASYLTFHTGARIVAAPAQAAFALIADPAALPDSVDFALGTDVYPDRSTTLILQVQSLATGPRFR